MKNTSAMRASVLLLLAGCDAFMWDLYESDCGCLSECTNAGDYIRGVGTCFVKEDCPEAFLYRANGGHGYRRLCLPDERPGGPTCDDSILQNCLNSVARTGVTGNEMDLMKGMCRCYDVNCSGNWESMPYKDTQIGSFMQQQIFAKTAINQTCTEVLQSPICDISCDGDCSGFYIEGNSASYSVRSDNNLRASLTFGQDAFYKFGKIELGSSGGYPRRYIEQNYCPTPSAGYSGCTVRRPTTIDNDAFAIQAGAKVKWYMNSVTASADWAFTCFRRCRVDCQGDNCNNIEIGSPDDLWARGVTRVSRKDYRDDERATLTFSRNGFVEFTYLETEKELIAHDYLSYDNGIPIAGTIPPRRFHVQAGKSMEWFSDMENHMGGWTFDYVCDLAQEI